MYDISETVGPLTVAEAAYRQIRADIVFGRLLPDEKLKLSRLKERYGVSVSTLREILNRLSEGGLVLAESQRGFEVAPVSPEALREIADLRTLLECNALELSLTAGDVEWEGRVVSAHHKLHLMETRMMAGERELTEQWKRYDWAFHQALISACGSKLLMELHSNVFSRYVRYQILALTFRGEPQAEEHRQLLQAALKRDVAGAQEALRHHVAAGVEECIAAKPFPIALLTRNRVRN